MSIIYFQTSNILEDLETLRLFARVIPEYSRSLEEADILENAFQIIFAFDEIVALGYRESVNLAQIRTFVEMDSHEEKVYQVSTNITFYIIALRLSMLDIIALKLSLN
jgi:hypothetical protein